MGARITNVIVVVSWGDIVPRGETPGLRSLLSGYTDGRMIDAISGESKLSLSHRANRNANALLSLSLVEPAQIGFGLRRLRRKLDAAIATTDAGPELCELASSYVKVIDPLLRLCQVPTPPRAMLAKGNGTNAKPVFDLSALPDA